jgi:hypothetical protein
MIDSTGSGAVVDECAWWAAELVVEGDDGSEGEKALKHALSQPGQGTGAVALECERALAAPEDRLDALTDRCQVRPSAGLILAGGSEDHGVELADRTREGSPGIALVADQDLAAVARNPRQQLQRDLALVALGRRHGDRSGRTVRRADRVHPEAPEEARVRTAVAVVDGIGQRRALNGLTTSGALDRGGVDQQRPALSSWLRLAKTLISHSRVSVRRRRRLK